MTAARSSRRARPVMAIAVTALVGTTACVASPGSGSAPRAPASVREASATPGASSTTPPATSGPAAATSSAQRAAAREPVTVSPARLAARITAVLGDDADDVSVTVHDRRTGATTRVNPSLRNGTASIVKVLVLVALIRERREDGRALSESQKALATAMMTRSDNDATDVLLRQAGGVRSVQKAADALKMTRTVVDAAWGTTTTSASDQALLMDALVGGTPVLSAADRGYVLGLMGAVVDEQRWGVGAVPDGVTTRVKNGWVESPPHGWRINSIGHVVGNGRDYTIAMLSHDNESMAAGISRLDAVSDVVYAASGS